MSRNMVVDTVSVEKIRIAKMLLFWWVGGHSFFDSFLIFLAKISCLSHRILRRILWPFIKMPARTFGRYLLSDVIAKNSYGIFYCRAADDDLDLVSESYEKPVIDFFKNNVRKASVCVDVGAHIGKYTVLLSKLVGKSGKVVAIEAHPKNFEILNKNIKLNKLRNIIALNLACANCESKMRFYEGPSALMHSGLIKTKKFILVKASKLDTILSKLKVGKMNFVKLDVEGMELAVLKGATSVLRKNKDVKIIFEAWDRRYLKNCVQILEKFGYKIKQLMPTMYLAYRQ